MKGLYDRLADILTDLLVYGTADEHIVNGYLDQLNADQEEVEFFIDEQGIVAYVEV